MPGLHIKSTVPASAGFGLRRVTETSLDAAAKRLPGLKYYFDPEAPGLAVESTAARGKCGNPVTWGASSGLTLGTVSGDYNGRSVANVDDGYGLNLGPRLMDRQSLTIVMACDYNSGISADALNHYLASIYNPDTGYSATLYYSPVGSDSLAWQASDEGTGVASIAAASLAGNDTPFVVAVSLNAEDSSAKIYLGSTSGTSASGTPTDLLALSARSRLYIGAKQGQAIGTAWNGNIGATLVYDEEFHSTAARRAQLDTLMTAMATYYDIS
jgi:hypothetical protein